MSSPRREFIILFIAIILILAATFIPYLEGYYHTPPDHVFTWIIPVTNIDVHPWLSWMRQGQEGQLLFEHKFWIEPHPPVIFYPYWLSMGSLSRSLKIPLIAAYHLGRILAGFFLLWFLYLFLSYFWEDAAERRWVWLFTALGSGWGWLTVLGIPMRSIDLWLPDAFVFYNLYGFPHIVFAQALMVLTAMSYLRARTQKSLSTALVGGVCCLLLTFIHPLDGLLLLGVFFLHSLDEFIQNKNFSCFGPAAVTALLTAPAVFYNVYIYAFHAVGKIMTQEYFFNTPNPLWLLSGYGLLFPLAALGVYWSRREKHFRLISYWLLLALFLSYLPLPHQRKFLEGSFIPLGILAGYGFFEGLRHWGRRRAYVLNKKGAAAAALLLLVSLGNIYIMAADTATFRNYRYEEYLKISESGQPPYLRKEFMEAFAWLEANTRRSEAVFSSTHSGNLIPAYAGNRVYVGHWYSVPRLAAKQDDVKAFFSTQIPEPVRRDFLQKKSLKYVFYGPFEESLGKYNPQQSSYLEKVFQNSLISIYKLKD